VRVGGVDLVGELEEAGQAGGIDGRSGAGFGQGEENGFGGDVADESVAGEGATAESGEGGIEAAATGLVSGKDFFFGVVGKGMQVDAEFDSGHVIFHLGEEFADQIGRGGANGVGEGDGVDADVLEPVKSVLDDFGAPGFVVGIAEGHGNVDDEIFVGGFGFALEEFDEGAGFGAGHVGVGAAEIGGDGVGITDGGDTGSGKGAAESFFVDDDADDFGCERVGRKSGEELGHDLFAVGHLLDVFGGDEADGVDVVEAGGDQFFQVSNFCFRGDEAGEALPGVTGTFDEFYGVHGGRKKEGL
jgi:hypothetical protein